MSSDSENATASAKRRVSPLMFVCLAVAGLAVLLGVFVAIMAVFRPDPDWNGRPSSLS